MMLRVKVTPRSPKSEITGTLSDGTIKIKIAAPAEKGKANEELIAFLSTHYQVPKSSIKIIAGQSTPRKLIEIEK
jgi:uncharacterized protein (TIGR00251 family)